MIIRIYKNSFQKAMAIDGDLMYLVFAKHIFKPHSMLTKVVSLNLENK